MINTDFYQLTMANGYLKNGSANRRAVFHFFFREHPFAGGYAVAAGLQTLLEAMQQKHFTVEDIAYFANLRSASGNPIFDADFLSYLEKFQFHVDMFAVPEGTTVFSHEPLLRIEGPLAECQILETMLSNTINFQTLVATKASRMIQASDYGELVEFGFRRAQGPDGAVSASRAAYIGGFMGTSNVEAGRLYGIPLRGTHSHSWVLAHTNEEEAFQSFYTTYPDNCIFLLDTFNTMAGLKKAVRLGKKIIAEKNPNFMLAGVRIDSGDLAYLSSEIRQYLDQHGFHATKIIAGNDLDEHIIQSLRDQGARIDVWAVGTRLVTAFDQPALGGVYKLSALEDNAGWADRIKLSEDATKINIPGRLQFSRYYAANDEPLFDAIYDLNLGEPQADSMIYSPVHPLRQRRIQNFERCEPLLIQVMKNGEAVYDPPPPAAIRQRTLNQLRTLNKSFKRFINPHRYPAGLEQKLHTKRNRMIEAYRKI